MDIHVFMSRDPDRNLMVVVFFTIKEGKFENNFFIDEFFVRTHFWEVIVSKFDFFYAIIRNYFI